MKKILLFATLFISMPLLANEKSNKVDTIEKLYSEIIYPFDYKHDSIYNLYKYSSRDFQNTIALAKANMSSIHHDYTEADMSECDSSYFRLKLIPPIDSNFHGIDFDILDNGNVRANIHFIQSYTGERYESTEQVIFSLNCNNSDNVCKITDVISYGQSAEEAIQRDCR